MSLSRQTPNAAPYAVWHDQQLYVSMDEEPVAYGFDTSFPLADIVEAGVQALLLARALPARLIAQRSAEAVAKLPSTSSEPAQPDAAVAAIRFALQAEEGLPFLRCWLHGQFDAIRKEWPEAPASVFLGAEEAGLPNLGVVPCSPVDQQQTGVYGKFAVRRVDGRDAPGGDRHGADYFVLDVTHDRFAKPALAAYAQACSDDYALLSQDLATRYDLGDPGELIQPAEQD